MQSVNISEALNQLTKVAFELSRRCPLSKEHVACPITYLQKEYDGYLPIELIFKFCEKLKEKNAIKAGIYFHIYNEPTVDARLLYIIHHLKQHIGIENRIQVNSNGWGLDGIIVRDLIREGITNFQLSAYSVEEYERMKIVKNKWLREGIGIKLFKQRLDPRLKIYTQDYCSSEKWKKLYHRSQFECTAPRDQFLVAATGDVIACELDWKYYLKCGNLKSDSLGTIFKKKYDLYNKIKADKLSASPCDRCECMYI